MQTITLINYRELRKSNPETDRQAAPYLRSSARYRMTNALSMLCRVDRIKENSIFTSNDS